jgi:hypothetical protein
MLADAQMSQRTDRITGRSHCGALFVLVMLVLPIDASADAKYQDALLLQGSGHGQGHLGRQRHGETAVKAENWVFVFKVGAYTYTANVNSAARSSVKRQRRMTRTDLPDHCCSRLSLKIPGRQSDRQLCGLWFDNPQPTPAVQDR